MAKIRGPKGDAGGCPPCDAFARGACNGPGEASNPKFAEYILMPSLHEVLQTNSQELVASKFEVYLAVQGNFNLYAYLQLQANDKPSPSPLIWFWLG